ARCCALRSRRWALIPTCCWKMPASSRPSAQRICRSSNSRRWRGPTRRSSAPELRHELGEASEALALGAFGGEDRFRQRDAAFELVVDDDVIVFRPVAGFLGRFLHPPLHDVVAVMGAGLEAFFQRGV